MPEIQVAEAPDVRDQATTEVHDHELVNAKLKTDLIVKRHIGSLQAVLTSSPTQGRRFDR